MTKIKKPVLPFTINAYVPNAIEVESKGKLHFYADGEGKAFQLKEEKMQLLKLGKTQVSQIITSYNFTHFLSASGQLFSMGKNSYGELGLGSTSKDVL